MVGIWLSQPTVFTLGEVYPECIVACDVGNRGSSADYGDLSSGSRLSAVPNEQTVPVAHGARPAHLLCRLCGGYSAHVDAVLILYYVVLKILKLHTFGQTPPREISHV